MFECINQKCQSTIHHLNKSKNIPVILIIFNNLTYLKNMLGQLRDLKVKSEDIWIWDNHSTYPPLLKFYKEISTEYNLVKNNKNYGPRFFVNPHVFNFLPNYFAVSDPDLSFNKKMPRNFLQYLKKITNELSLFKAGLALDISPNPHFNKNLRIKSGSMTIRQRQKPYWSKPLAKYNNPKIYNAPIDTTFAVYNKKHFKKGFFNAVRVADHFTCKHLPWYKNTHIPKEEKELFNTSWSHWTN
ncbi:hypothetical protein IC619_012305 [Hazenella sp. IB182353]|uniref:hypothetical protein n=1 Tax=Polycladospora coralii TaxID=2771432 RepID=UPI0017473053|nr:hypothetical protein [Polycladospora coralii]MBS7531274.1 hypothetical protein [Polycladospora coralii]